MEKLTIRSKVGLGRTRKYGFINYRKLSGGCYETPQEIRMIFINRYYSKKMSQKVENMFQEIKQVIYKYYDFQEENLNHPSGSFQKMKKRI